MSKLLKSHKLTPLGPHELQHLLLPAFPGRGWSRSIAEMQLSGAPEIDLEPFGSGSKPLAEA